MLNHLTTLNLIEAYNELNFFKIKKWFDSLNLDDKIQFLETRFQVQMTNKNGQDVEKLNCEGCPFFLVIAASIFEELSDETRQAQLNLIDSFIETLKNHKNLNIQFIDFKKNCALLWPDDSDSIQDDFFTPLTAAVTYSDIDIVKLLLKAGADPDFPNPTESEFVVRTPLGSLSDSKYMYPPEAEVEKKVQIFELLMEKGVRFNQDAGLNGNTALHFLVQTGEGVMLRLLEEFIKVGIDLKKTNHEGLTPLEEAFHFLSNEDKIYGVDYDVKYIDLVIKLIEESPFDSNNAAALLEEKNYFEKLEKIAETLFIKEEDDILVCPTPTQPEAESQRQIMTALQDKKLEIESALKKLQNKIEKGHETLAITSKDYEKEGQGKKRKKGANLKIFESSDDHSSPPHQPKFP